jgi:hypothetical protein
LEVQGKNGKAPRFKVKSFELELQGTSQEPGVAINYPLQPKAEKLFDLQFAGVDGDGQVIHVDSDNGSSGSAIINAFDGGAYATLKATAILEGGIRIQGHLLKADGSTSISIPFRTESSRIGASWSKVNGNMADNADEEKLPGNDYAGDGLTSYEEYRGVFSEGRFNRLSALKKELGVRVAAADKGNFAQGINLFSTATGVQAIVLNDNELDKDRVINKNSIYAHLYTQHGVWLVRDDRGGAAGYNEPKELLNKTPAKSEKVVINVQHHEDIFTAQQAALKAANISMPYTMEQDLAVTVAHELGHSIHLDHHGPSFLERPRHIPANTPTTFLIYDYFGKQIFVPFDVEGTIGIPGNDASGDLNCIMAYTNSYQWVLRKQSEGVLVYQTVPATPVGNSLCTDKAGTGINKNDNFFGAAKQGNCRSRIRVRDP